MITLTEEEIKSRLWEGANELRGSMDASRYKDYMLGLMFYKFLSDKTLETFKMTSGLNQVTDSELVEEYIKAKSEYGEELNKLIQNVLGYFVAPEYLYQTWIKDINSGDFEVQKVTDSLNNFERTIAVTEDSDDFKGLFSSSTLDLTDTALGSNLNERSKNIKSLILLFADLNMVSLQSGDVLGNAYEYLIGQFAMESGKKAGEFYTPRQVSEVMAQIAAKTSDIKSIYDPTVGSGSLLLTLRKHLDEDVQKNLSYYGQEKNTATYNLTRMNLLLHGVRPEKMTIKNGDTLGQDWPEDPQRPNHGVQFDAVVMNPPYSVKNWNKSGLKVSDPRFEIAGTLPPDSKGDYAFLLHGLFHLGQNGTMAIVLPHGVLFRGSSEGDIRERLLQKNYIDTIIGLPSNLFSNTGIPVVVLILKKNRKVGDTVLVIDASKNFKKDGKINVLLEKDIAKIVDTYVERREEKGYSHLATREEILENQYNMNIPRYVEHISDDVPHDVDGHLLGGIPKKNIEDLKVLHATVPNILDLSLKVVRDGYVELLKSIDEISDEVLNDDRILIKSQNVREKVMIYVNKYWDIFKKVNSDMNLAKLKEEMLVEIKEILCEFEFVDVYEGYQIVAEIWDDVLLHDLETIALSDFYTAGRTREPNMVTKGQGSKKRKEQDGWVGKIVTNDLIAKHFYVEDLRKIESMKSRVQEIDMELSELVEAAKVDDSYEFYALDKVFNEAGEDIDFKKVKDEIKKSNKGTVGYDLLVKVNMIYGEKADLGKLVKENEKALIEWVYDRILLLTDEEIEQLMYEKWFGNIVDLMANLVVLPIKVELKRLHMLSDRYYDTLSVIDVELDELESSFESLMSELVVL